jgi:hypothetical protein
VSDILGLKWNDDGYECRFCGQKFASDSEGKKHVRDRHPVTATGVRK